MEQPLQHLLRVFAAVIYIICSAPGMLEAQGLDVRISPYVPEYQIPTSIRIEDAAQIGNVSLAVWGTVRKQSDTTVVPELVWQMRRDTVTLDVPTRVHSEEARPFDVVSIVALSDRFLVLWNDSRNGDSMVYGRVFDTSGVWSGNEFMFSTGRLQGSGDVVSISSATGYKIFWNDNRSVMPGLYCLDLDQTLNIAHPERYVDSVLIKGVSRFHAYAADLVIEREDGSGLLVGSDDEFTMRKSLSDIFNHPTYINDDGSLVVLRDTVLYFYQSLFDSTVQRRIAIPGLINGDPNFRWSTDLYCVVRDSMGHYGIIYPWYSSITQTIRKTVIVVDTLFQIDTLEHLVIPYNTPISNVGTDGGSYSRLCNNNVVIEWKWWFVERQNPFQNRNVGAFYKISPEGEVVRYWKKVNAYFLLKKLIVSRQNSNSRSEIQVDDWNILGVDMPLINRRKIYQLPFLINWNGKIKISWYRELLYWIVYDLSLKDLKNIENKQNLLNSPHGYLIINEASPHPNGSSSRARAIEAVDDVYLQSGNLEFYSTKTGNSTYTHGFSYQEDMMLLVDGEWKTVLSATNRWYNLSSSFNVEPPPFPFWSYVVGARIPGATTVLVYHYGAYQEIDTKGSILWEMPSKYPSQRFFTIGSRDVISLVNDTYTRIRDGIVEPTKVLQSSFAPILSQYQPLYDSSFIAWRIVPDDSLRLHIRRYNFDGELLRDTVLEFSEKLNEVRLQLNPSDSSVVMMCSTGEGVRLSYLDRYLYLWRDPQGNPLHDVHGNVASDSVRHVSGLFRGDTLLLVWEDYRYGDGIADIYCNTWVAPKNLTSDHPNQPHIDTPEDETPEDNNPNTDQPATSGSNSELTIASIAPNPAREMVEIAVQTPAAAKMQLYVYDAMGRQVWSKAGIELKVGTSTIMMDVVGLGPGTYTVVAQAQGKVSRQRLIVLH